jgi:hypothetical protein
LLLTNVVGSGFLRNLVLILGVSALILDLSVLTWDLFGTRVGFLGARLVGSSGLGLFGGLRIRVFYQRKYNGIIYDAVR